MDDGTEDIRALTAEVTRLREALECIADAAVFAVGGTRLPHWADRTGPGRRSS